jgi:hypothetical protein
MNMLDMSPAARDLCMALVRTQITLIPQSALILEVQQMGVKLGRVVCSVRTGWVAFDARDNRIDWFQTQAEAFAAVITVHDLPPEIGGTAYLSACETGSE